MTQPDLSPSQQQEITEYINNYRRIHQSPPLEWDETITQFSRKWSKELIDKNMFKHSENSLYSENLVYFQGYGTNIIELVKMGMDMFYDEIKLYDFENPGFTEETGHFTALIWKASTHYGLGIAVNPMTKSVIIVMNMSPPGNYYGRFRDNVLPPTEEVISSIIPIPILMSPNDIQNIEPSPVIAIPPLIPVVPPPPMEDIIDEGGMEIDINEVIDVMNSIIISLRLNHRKYYIIHYISNYIEILKKKYLHNK